VSFRLRCCAAVAAALIASLALAACGGGEETATSAEKTVKPAQLGPSVETEAAAFVERPGTELDRVLTRFLGPVVKTKVEPGSAICRPGTATPSIDNATRYPFACIVRATADGEGLEVEITLGFVGTELDGSCWRAANERVLVTTTEPTLLGNKAKRPVDQIEGCV
jgi:hypothetical protein